MCYLILDLEIYYSLEACIQLGFTSLIIVCNDEMLGCSILTYNYVVLMRVLS